MNGVNETDYVQILSNAWLSGIKISLDVSYNIRGHKLAAISFIKDLGVYLGKKLMFQDHFDFVTLNVSKILALVMRMIFDFADFRSVDSVHFTDKS